MPEKPPSKTTSADFIWLAVLLVIAGTLVWVGAGMLVALLLGFVVIISAMTLMAVFQERGQEDPDVQRTRKSMGLGGLIALPIPIIWLLGGNPLLTLIPMAAFLVFACWKWFAAKPPMGLRILLRGAAEKQPGYLDHQVARIAVFVLVIFAIYGFDPSRVGTTLRDFPGIAAENRRLATVAHESDVEQARQHLEAISAAADRLLEVTTKLTIDLYAEMSTEEKNEFLDDVEAEEDGAAKRHLLTRLLEHEEDPALKTRITGLLGEQ